MKKINKLIILALCINFANAIDYTGEICSSTTSKRYPIAADNTNILNPFECHCKETIKYNIADTEYDMSLQLHQMIIDQKNFVDHYVKNQMREGIKRELIGVTDLANQTAAMMSDYDELVFLSQKLVEEIKTTNKYGTLELKGNILESGF